MLLRRMTVAVLSLGLLAGCGAGHNSITIKPYTPTDGNQAQSDSVKVRNFVVVASANGSGVVVGTAVNSASTSDAITSMTVNNVPVTFTPASLPLETNKPVIFGGESATASATVPSFGAKPGQLVPITINFANAAPVRMTIVVRDATGEFANLAPAPTPEPSESTTP